MQHRSMTQPTGFFAAAARTAEGNFRLRDHASPPTDRHRPGTALGTLHQQIVRLQHRHDSSTLRPSCGNDAELPPFRTTVQACRRPPHGGISSSRRQFEAFRKIVRIELHLEPETVGLLNVLARPVRKTTFLPSPERYSSIRRKEARRSSHARRPVSRAHRSTARHPSP